MAEWTSTPKTWVAGETLLAADLNDQLRDALTALSSWNSYTPTLAQGSASDIAYTNNFCRYLRLGSTVVANGYIQATAAGDAGDITLTLPVTPAYGSSVFISYGSGAVRDNSGAADYGATVVSDGSSAMAWRRVDTDPGGLIGTSPAFAVASGDVFTWNIVYEAA